MRRSAIYVVFGQTTMAYHHLKESCVVSAHHEKSNNFDSKNSKRIGEKTTSYTMKNQEEKHKQMKRESRRPEIQIYKPGMGIWSKNSQKSTKDDTRTNCERSNSVHSYVNHDVKKVEDDAASITSQKEKSSPESDNSRKSKNKRPDLPVYTVPKNRSLALQENKKTNEQDNKKASEIKTKVIMSTDTHKHSVCNGSITADQASSYKRYSRAGYKKHRTAGMSTNIQSSSQEDLIFERTPKQHNTSANITDKLKNDYKNADMNQSERTFHNLTNSKNSSHNNCSSRRALLPVKNALNSQNTKEYIFEDTDETSEIVDYGRTRKKKMEKMSHRSSRKDYNSTNFTNNIAQEEDWDAELMPLENLCLSAKTFSQEDSYSFNNKDNSEEKHTESHSVYESSDGDEHSEPLIESKIITPSKNTAIESSCRKVNDSRNEDNVQRCESGSSENSLSYLPKIKDWSEEVEASEMTTQCVDDLQEKNVFVQPDYKYQEEAKKEIEYRKKLDLSNEKGDKSNLTQEHNSSKSFNKKRIDHVKDKKVDRSLPPRFQKGSRKNEVLDDKSNDVKSGGIIRIPSEACDVDEVVSPSAPSMSYICPEQPCIVQKQLYDPNNPDKPLIVMKQQPLIYPPKSHANVNLYGIGQCSLMPSLQNQFGCVDVPAMSSVIQPSPASFAYPVASYPPPSVPPVLPVCYSDLLLQDNENRRIKPLVKKNLHDIRLLERELASHLAQGINKCDMKAVSQCRWKLRLRYENIILADPRHCAEQNVEQSLWKSVFYQVIEALRRQMEEETERKEDARQSLMNCVDEGTVFYENLLEKQQETFGFNLSQYLENAAKPQRLPDSVRLVLISIQKIYIYLGDLARYKEQANSTSNYGKARSFYLQAQRLAPKNGRPYNQLAILAVYTRRKLDAVYYYMRSLAASNPFLTARESLLSLFEDARKKYEQAEKKRSQEKIDYMEDKVKGEREERYEVWIHPDGSSSKRTSKTEEDPLKEELSKMDTFDLNKRFVISFLHAHGKLFSKVGMETFKDTATHMLMEFSALLQRTPFPVGPFRLLQLQVINMFSVANTSLKDQNLESQCWSPLQELAVQLSLTMVTILLERTVVLLKEHLQSEDYPTDLVSEDLASLLPVIKIWTDWMSSQLPIWYPTPPPCNLKVGCKDDVWTAFASLLTVLRTVDISDQEIVSEYQEGYEFITLPEDTTLAGFVPLLNAPESSFFVKSPFDQERAKHCLRISRIQFFGDYLCGIPSPYLEFDVEKKMFVSLVSDISSEENTESGQDMCYELSDDDVPEDIFDDDEGKVSGLKGQEDNDIQMLWSRKEALRKTKARQDRYRAKVQAVLHEHRQKRPTKLEVRPRFLIPDTNCFIDHLDGVKRLVNSVHFVLVVPIVVINELDGLARGTRESLYTSSEHVKKVAQLSRDAIHFLEERFSVRDSRVKAITSKGSTLDTITFRSEDVSDNKGTNDDLILSCCLHYCKDKKESTKDSEGPVRLVREAVLLTEDKNLRVKALAHNVPVRDLPEFLKWANIR